MANTKMLPRIRQHSQIFNHRTTEDRPLYRFSVESPRVFLSFGCGCKKYLRSLRESIEHAKKYGHVVTVRGNLRFANYGLDPTGLINGGLLHDVELLFACGDGFSGHSLGKAVEHVAKSQHSLAIQGKINPRLKGEHVEQAFCRPRAELYTVAALKKVLGSEKGRQSEKSQR